MLATTGKPYTADPQTYTYIGESPDDLSVYAPNDMWSIWCSVWGLIGCYTEAHS